MNLKFGICGTGDISTAFMKSAKELDLEVHSVMQRNLEKAKNFSLLHKIPAYYDDLDKMLESDIDIVYVGLPNSLHYETAKTCLMKGKHVLLEKPVTIYKNQFEELIELAQKHHVYLLEVDRVEHLSAYKQIKKIIQNDYSMIQVDYCKRSRRYDAYLNGELPHIFDREYGGGAMYDLGVYALHFIVGLAGKPQSISYTMEKGKGNVDMYGVLSMTYKNFIASITVSKVSHGESRVVIQSDQYKIISNTPPSILSEVKLYKDNKETIYSMKENSFTMFLREAIRIMNEKDETEYQRLTNKSKEVIALLNEILVDYIDQ